MTFSAVLRDLRARFDCGEFFLAPGDSLRDVVRRAGVPREFGVYVVHAMLGRKRELVYIGKAGTILQNGAIAAQTLPERLTNRQNGMSRARFFSERIAQEGIDRLHFGARVIQSAFAHGDHSLSETKCRRGQAGECFQYL